MKATTRNRLGVFYVISAPSFLLLCLGAIVAVIVTSKNAMAASSLLMPTSIAAWGMRRCADWLN